MKNPAVWSVVLALLGLAAVVAAVAALAGAWWAVLLCGAVALYGAFLLSTRAEGARNVQAEEVAQ